MGAHHQTWPVTHRSNAHVLRHSYASLSSDLGYSELTIAALVGHMGPSETSRYVHSADAVLLAVADAVADRTAELRIDNAKAAWRQVKL
jgi:integrase